VNSKQILSTPTFGLQPAPAWTAIGGFVMITALCLVAASGVMRYAFPLSALVVGAFLYFRYPVFYVSFTWWIWFLTPAIARIVDFKSGWDPQRLMLVSPFLVTLISFVTLARRLPKSYFYGGLPFILVFVAVVYGFLIGMIKNSPMSAARACLDWVAPIVFGFHLFANWREYPKLSQNIQRTFLWGVLVTGVYGVVQYLIAPMWDRFWIIETELVTNGSPEPLGIRVFSTMHSPFPFAVTMMAGLLLLFNAQAPLRIPAAAAGYLSFLLSAVRSAWGGWFISLLVLLTSMKARLQRRLIVSILVMVVCVLPLTTISPFSDVISARFESFSNISGDVSYNDRTALYNEKLGIAMSDLLGKGMGGTFSTTSQGNVAQVPLDRFGAIPYITGLILVVFTLFQSSKISMDAFANAARAIAVGVLAQIGLGGAMLSLAGIVLWCFIGMSMAARNYYQHQRATAYQTRL
jgi:hypothetical protein